MDIIKMWLVVTVILSIIIIGGLGYLFILSAAFAISELLGGIIVMLTATFFLTILLLEGP